MAQNGFLSSLGRSPSGGRHFEFSKMVLKVFRNAPRSILNLRQKGHLGGSEHQNVHFLPFSHIFQYKLYVKRCSDTKVVAYYRSYHFQTSNQGFSEAYDIPEYN